MAERYLIVNADDFGRCERINAGIIRAHQQGIVTSTSLMVRWPAAVAAAAYAREHRALAVGLHLDLGEWEQRDGEWPAVYQVLEDVDDADAVATALRSQLETCRRLLGRDPTHVDSHQHVHQKSDAVAAAAERLAAELGVPLRHRDERITYCGAFYGQSHDGEAHPNLISAERLIELIEGLAPGITELVCHPGEGAEGVYNRERRAELEAVCDPRVRAAVECEGVRLRSFAEIAGL